jgi:predicted RecB family nuclease
MELELFIEKLKEITEKHKKLKKTLKDENNIIGVLINLKSSHENKEYNNEINTLVKKYKENTENHLNPKNINFLIKFYNSNYTNGINSESDFDLFELIFGNRNY